ncbi:enoyl-CoA hydratase [Phenylobacterium sp. VNQ135]|uniref:enoyl-CoA hydratase n=1 Tax=Phenylobacterium sp. VNQ135 TaxID=3400922 RepID=UPI003BFBE054
MTTTTTAPRVALQNVLYERLGAVARIYHHRPNARNAENTALLDELNEAFRTAGADPEVRVIILGGSGSHFSAGHDLKEAMTDRAHYTVEERWDYEAERYFGYALNIWDCPKPTIAQVQGACVAGAFMVANMCDLIVASDDAFFADPVCQTLAAASCEVLIHPWVMGLRRAKELLFTGERMDAQEAYRIGMVNRIVPTPDLQEATLALAEKIAATPPFAMKLLKRSLNRTWDVQGLRSALSAHFETHQLTHVTDETKQIRLHGPGAAIGKGRSGPSRNPPHANHEK